MRSILGLALAALTLAACEDSNAPQPLDPNTAPHAAVDRFSAAAGNLFVRTGGNGLPAANAPIDFDQAPFITDGLGPNGELVSYYNFDVQPVTPAPIYVLFREGEGTPVAGQLNIIDALPGDADYNDFWQVVRVDVPADYVANTATSLEDLDAAGYPRQITTMIVNCPVVPEGSTAALRVGGGSTALVRGWYRDQVVFYFSFEEHALGTTPGDEVPVSPIYVAFNINPDQPGGGPPSGFLTEMGSSQTHNVVATLPGDGGYAPLWSVNIYDNADFDSVDDLTSALAATQLVAGAALVNCPVVSVP
jgi:hypothetical protein